MTVLTGAWRANDGGTYYLRQIGNTIWWVGMSNNSGKLFTNVYRGIIQEDKIDGEWADVPVGSLQSNGVLSLKIVRDSDNEQSILQKLLATGGFSASAWQKLVSVE